MGILREPSVVAALASGPILLACAAVSLRVWPLLMLWAIVAAAAVGQARHREDQTRVPPPDRPDH